MLLTADAPQPFAQPRKREREERRERVVGGRGREKRVREGGNVH